MKAEQKHLVVFMNGRVFNPPSSAADETQMDGGTNLDTAAAAAAALSIEGPIQGCFSSISIILCSLFVPQNWMFYL